MRWLSRLITIAIFVAVAAGAALLFRAEIPSQRVGQNFKTWVNFRDGSRLAVGSPVVIAGVRVGDIVGLSIRGGLARVDLRLQDNVQLPVDTWATRRADSLFGDSYVELIPSNADEGAARATMLKSGEPISRVEEGGSTDTTLRSMGKALPRVDNALDITHDAVGGARAWVNGQFANGVAKIEEYVASGRIEAPIERLDRAMVNIDTYTERAAASVADAKPEVDHTFDRIEKAIAKARGKIHDIKGGVGDGLANVREGLNNIDPTVDKLDEVVAAVNEGRGKGAGGTIGRLANDPKLGNDLDEITESAEASVRSLTRLRSWLGLRVEWDVFSKAPRFYATAELRTRSDKFFLFELEKGPLGGLPDDELSEAPGATSYTRTSEINDALRITAQYGKQFGRLGLRGGLKDSTFGVGADLWLNDNKLELQLDVFGGFTSDPRVKLTAAYAIFRSAYLIAGIDDAFTKPGYLPIAATPNQPPDEFVTLRYGRDYFVGAILHFDDADLTTLLRVYGAFITGLL